MLVAATVVFVAVFVLLAMLVRLFVRVFLVSAVRMVVAVSVRCNHTAAEHNSAGQQDNR